MADIIIRNYRTEEKRAVHRISVENSIFAEYKDELLDETIFADLLTSYFIEYEPQSCFIAEKDGEIIGYVLGSEDVLEMRKKIKYTIIPDIAKKMFSNGLLFRSHNLKLFENIIRSLFRGEFNVPDFYMEYPATLHVNIAAQYRGKMAGTLLVNHFLKYLKIRRVKGIHFGVLSERAKSFFLKLGFEILFKGEYSFLRYLSGETLPHYIMGKKL